VTDNAGNLCLAFDPSELKRNLVALLDQPILNVHCGSHSANLALRDVENQWEQFATFKTSLMALMTHLRQKRVKHELRGNGVTEKIPKVQDIKSMELYDAAGFARRHQDVTNVTIRSRSFERLALDDGCVKIIVEVILAFGQFTFSIQENGVCLHHFYHKCLKTIDQLDARHGSELAARLRAVLSARMDTTADSPLTELAYVFRPRVLESCRDRMVVMEQDDSLKRRDEAIRVQYILLHGAMKQMRDGLLRVSFCVVLQDTHMVDLLNWYLHGRLHDPDQLGDVPSGWRQVSEVNPDAFNFRMTAWTIL
jgi:hypothetical protein